MNEPKYPDIKIKIHKRHLEKYNCISLVEHIAENMAECGVSEEDKNEFVNYFMNTEKIFSKSEIVLSEGRKFINIDIINNLSKKNFLYISLFICLLLQFPVMYLVFMGGVLENASNLQAAVIFFSIWCSLLFILLIVTHFVGKVYFNGDYSILEYE